MKEANKNNKPNVPKFKFSPYWIYGVIFIGLIVFQFLNSGSLGSKGISSNKFYEVLKDDHIDKIIIVHSEFNSIFETTFV